MFRIYNRFLNHSFETVAVGGLYCVYQKRIDTYRGGTFVYPSY